MSATINAKVTILVGAGAVENAWKPILNIFRLINGDETDQDSANFLFAKSICALRLYSKLPQRAKQLKEEQELVSSMKEVIGDSLKLAQKDGTLKPRKEFATMLDKFVLCSPNNLFGFVTTNWDTVIDAEADRWVKDKYLDIESAKVFHIHGSIEAHEHLYLPSETSMENYRSDAENERLGYAHFATFKLLKEANSIILYGLSLDPLDAELNLLLGGAFKASKTIKEVIIVNPNYQLVRKRVKILLFRKTGIAIRCFDPENLEIEL
ncbi:hypothetical protein ABS764_02615 [Flavobacterium sp. ST-87]|uniref:SIR2-like domain-containing protein n=1 Tax=Flavobacterium plantiphilum TaxID=3163297 RepID=A0ABW8XQ33_9FLAO